MFLYGWSSRSWPPRGRGTSTAFSRILLDTFLHRVTEIHLDVLLVLAILSLVILGLRPGCLFGVRYWRDCPRVLGVLHEGFLRHLVLVVLVAVSGGQGGGRGVVPVLGQPLQLLLDQQLLIRQQQRLGGALLNTDDDRKKTQGLSSYICLELEVRLTPLRVHWMIAQPGAPGSEGLGELLKRPLDPGGRHHHVQQGQAHNLNRGVAVEEVDLMSEFRVFYNQRNTSV